MIYAAILGFLRRRQPDHFPPPVPFVPHWQMMLFLGFAVFAVLAPSSSL